MAEKTGCREPFFKAGEGRLADGVAAIRSGCLRLYCITYGQTAIIIGGGGGKHTRTWQESEKLSQKVQMMEQIADKIYKLILDKEIIIDKNGEIQTNEYTYETD